MNTNQSYTESLTTNLGLVKMTLSDLSDADLLVRKLRESAEIAVREGRLEIQQAGQLLRFYEDGLHGYTYLEEPSE